MAQVGLRHVAKTSPSGCKQCDLPDERSICSNLSHPSVSRDPTTKVRSVGSIYCSLSRPEAAQPSQCRPDGNSCWQRLLDPEIARAGGTPLVVAENSSALGVIYLKDIVKGGLKDRLARLRAMGIAPS